MATSFLNRFKNLIQYSNGIDKDQYFIDEYISPSIEKATSKSVNYRYTVINIITSSKAPNAPISYDLTQSSIASPVVPPQGIQNIIYDRYVFNPFVYKEDFYIQNKTVLYLLRNLYSATQLYLKYNQYYTVPIIPINNDTYIETDLPTPLWKVTLRYAMTLYFIDIVTAPNYAIEKQEANLKTKYFSSTESTASLQGQILNLEKEMTQIGATSRPNLIRSHQGI